jgi:Tfp pilus assembly PilM family ATPase
MSPASSAPRRSSLSLRDAPPPEAAVAIGATHVAAATLDLRGGQPVILQHAVEPVADGAVVPALTARNVRDGEEAAAAVARALDRIGRPRRVGLVLPDPVAKVSLVRFDQVPSRTDDLDQLVRWQVRKAAPFPVEEAQVSFVDAGPADGGHEFIVTLARRDVVEEYEALCASAGAHAGLVDLSTFNVVNLVLAGPDAPAADWLLVNMAPEWASIAILRGRQLTFFRTRGAEADATLADLVHQTAMYYEDRLQGAGLSRALLCGAAAASEQPAEAERIQRNLEERLAMAVETVDPRTAARLADRIAAAPALLDALAPLAGLLLREREVAA